MQNRPTISAEIIVVGAGLAGAAAAAVLGRQGRRVILVDPRPTCPPVFKAEKIDRGQVQQLRKFGLLEQLLPFAGKVREVQVAYNGRVFRTTPIEQYGISYPDMVNALRCNLPPSVEFRLGRVELILNGGQMQRVKLAAGEELSARLVILASGASKALYDSLRLRRRTLRRDQSLVFGFNLAACEPEGFDFDSITCYSIAPSTRIDYLTLFRIRHTMRANLFVFRSANDPWVRDFILRPEEMLQRHLPHLNRITGSFRVVDKVESGRVDLYKVEGNPQPGVVLIGDAFQSVCPSTGMGLAKILTDVDALSECVPRWLATPGMGTDKLADFFNHPRKLATDSRALASADHHRSAATASFLRWRTYRFLLHHKWRLESVLELLRRRSRKCA